MGSKSLRQVLMVALVVGCTTDHEIATLDTHTVDEVCQELCKKSAACGVPGEWCDESGCDGCVAQCTEDAYSTGDWDPEDDYCQRMLDAAIDCAHDASCTYYFDGIGTQPDSCLRTKRATLACYGDTLDTPGTSAAVSTSASSGGSGGSEGSGDSGGFGGSVSAASGSIGGTGAVTTATATSSGIAAYSFVSIPFHNGWASLNDNDVGIQGAFYTFDDNESGGTSVIEPENFADSGDTICVQGLAGQVENGPDGSPAYADYWGAGVGFNLAQEEGNDVAVPYDATNHKVAGFRFELNTLDFPDGPGELRFNIKVAGDTNYYCSIVVNDGAHAFLLSSLWQSCWENDPMAPTPDPSQLVSLEWWFVTNASSSYPFQMCIGMLEAITD